jgi:hypothetical protein
MEAELQFLGFDFTYDKRLYDRMLRETPGSVRDHLLASLDYQRKLVRFTENHDESRAASAFGLPKSQAAAVLASTLPGAKMFHDGQFEGRKIKVPVQLNERAPETPNSELSNFYRRLTAELSAGDYHNGIYMALATNPMLDHDESFHNLIAFAWTSGKSLKDGRIVIVNLSDQAVRGRVMLPALEFSKSALWCFQDALNPDISATYNQDQLLVGGLPIELAAYQSHIFSIIAKGESD